MQELNKSTGSKDSDPQVLNRINMRRRLFEQNMHALSALNLPRSQRRDIARINAKREWRDQLPKIAIS